jgi:hypothetical protein
MAIRTLIIKDFTGGIGTLGEKRDLPGSAKFTKALDPFEDTSYVTLARKATKKSATTITGLPHWIEDGSPWSTDKYVYDSAGKLYKVNSSDVVSDLRTVSGGAGEGLKVYHNALYYGLGTNLGRYAPLNGTPSFTAADGGGDDFTAWGDVSDVQQEISGNTGNAYTLTTAVNEGATHRQTWTPEHDPIYSVRIDVLAKGSGDWTVTVHDEWDSVVGTSTKANGDVSSTATNEFVLSSVGRVITGNSYHYHVTSTVADGTVDTGTASDLEDSDYFLEYGVLIDVDWHPMAINNNDDLVIGNESYIATWDEATYNPTAINVGNGFEARSIAVFEEFIVAACYKGGSINQSEEAKLVFWDGVSANANYQSPIAIGVPNAIYNAKGELVGVYGTRGSFYRGADPFEQVVHEIPKLARGKYCEVYPGAITDFNGRTLVGYAGVTDDTTGLEQGVYEYGSQTDQLNKAFNFPYLISTANTQATNQKIGLIKAIGDNLWIGWRDDSNYGLDKIAYGDNSAASGVYESLIFDGGDPDQEMNPLNLIITFEALTTGQSVTPKYKKDRAAAFTAGTAANTVGDTRLEEPLYGRCNEIEVGFTLASSSGTFPKITSVELEWDDLREETET